MVLADSGEDAIAWCDEDNYASNVETAATVPADRKRAAAISGTGLIIYCTKE